MPDTRRTRRIEGDGSAKATILIAATPEGVPMFSGIGGVTYLCCGCDKLLVKDLAAAQMRPLVFQCGQCGATSEIPARDCGY